MFSSFLRQGSQGGTFLRLGVSRVDESNDIIGIHPDFGVATISPEVMECRLWSGKVFLFYWKWIRSTFRSKNQTNFPVARKGQWDMSEARLLASFLIIGI